MAICLAVLLLSVFSCSDPLAGWLRKKQQNRALGALYYWASRESIVPFLVCSPRTSRSLLGLPGVLVMHVTQGRSQDPAVLKGEDGVCLLLLLPWDHGTLLV